MMYSSESITLEQHFKWFNDMNKSETSLSRIFYYDGKPYGVVQFLNIDKENGTCEWSFYIGEHSAPKGMGTVLGVVALNYIFKEIKIRKLNAEVLGYNDTSYFYHQKLGFKQEGCLRKQVLKQGQYTDIFLFGQLSIEWEEKSKNIEGKLNLEHINNNTIKRRF